MDSEAVGIRESRECRGYAMEQCVAGCENRDFPGFGILDELFDRIGEIWSNYDLLSVVFGEQIEKSLPACDDLGV
jgi:hypothetical protein